MPGSGNSLDLPPAASGPKACPNCQTPNADTSLFCEACGYDFTTGALPRGVVTNVETPAPSAPEPSAPEPSAPEPTEPGAIGPSEVEPSEVEPAEVEPTELEAGEIEPGESEPVGPELTPEAPGEIGEGEGSELGGDGVDPAATSEPSGQEPDSDDGDGQPAGVGSGIPASGGGDPTVPPRIPFQWVAEVWIDPDWYADQQAEEPLPSAGLPVVVPLRVASALIGRASTSRQIHPDIDCSADPGVSRRHAQLTTDGSRWFVEDLQSSNGTFVGPASGPLPRDPVPVGPKTEVADNRVYVGAWTRIVVRRATDEEIAIG